ncbi:DUF445 family protein [bacterium]|nr:DUF445 family protein [bacterium]
METILLFFNIDSEVLPLFVLPLVGAVIGWVTNFIAVKMLFHPRKPYRLLFFELHGVFPKRQRALAEKLGHIVSEELFSANEVISHIQDAAQSQEMIDLISDHIEKVIRQRLPEVIPMISFVLNDDLVQTVRQTFVGELKIFLKEVTDKLAGSIEADLDVHKIVEEKVLNFSSDKLEEILFAIMRREFRFIEVIGAVLGFLIGLVQLAYLLSIGGFV